MLFSKIQKIDLFAYILFFFLVLYFFNIFVIHQNFEEVGSAKLLLLNYDGGFIRRALLGEIVTNVSLFLNVIWGALFSFENQAILEFSNIFEHVRTFSSLLEQPRT